jgi:hypothetical protein
VALAEADGLALGLAVEPADPDAPGVPGHPDGLADDEAGPVGVWDGEAVDAGTDPDGADALGEVAGLCANCVQAAMITTALAGSALPPTPLRSTK